MFKIQQPGALASDRAGELILGGMSLHTAKQDAIQLPRIVSWRVTRWLAVEAVEVRRES